MVEVLDDFRTPLRPPHLRARDLLSIFQSQRVGQIRIGIRFCFIIVDGVRRFRIVGVRARSERCDVEQFHHALMILLGGHHNRRTHLAARLRSGWIRCLRNECENERREN